MKTVETRNNNGVFVEGTNNLRASSFKDHTASTMHKKAKILFKQQQGVDIVKYFPIAAALLDEASRKVATRTFEVAYIIAKKNCL